jgi:putative iron-regulated protein
MVRQRRGFLIPIYFIRFTYLTKKVTYTAGTQDPNQRIFYMRRTVQIFALSTAPFLATEALAANTPAEIIATYADIGAAAYSDSLTSAQALQNAVRALIATPSDTTMTEARQAWLRARVPYMQTEVFRFGNPIVDDWEGKVNAWPLDEGLIDYVAPSYFGAGENDFSALNVVATPEFTFSGQMVDAREITATLLVDVLHEAGENEANVATGYHAIEFLLWGQDLTSDAPVAGQRPFTDFMNDAACTNGNCDRRAAYLSTATDLLVSDLAWNGPMMARRAAH